MVKRLPCSARRKRGATAYNRGLWAEALSRFWLRLKLYRIVASRAKTPLGEIDIIAVRGQTLVFVEVKARPEAGQAAEAVSSQQKERLARAAALFLGRNPLYGGFHARFDVILVLPWRLPRHIENAFENA